jgi:ElaB/YqjD/DUF883 family membrane-anchored ribosome-binding protein
MTDSRTDTKSGNDNQSRGRAGQAYEATRAKTSAAYSGAKERASSATQKLGSNPVAAIAGGFAVGAVLAAVLPSTRRETELLGGVGGKITDAARDAANSAVEAGRAQVEELTETAATRVGQAVIGAVTASAGGGNDTGGSSGGGATA